MASQPAMAIFEKSDTSQKLFCGGLPGMITTEDLRLHFEKFGTLDECVVKHSPGNVGNAFGFLWVRPVEAAEKIMAQDHIIHTASGHDISIPAPVLARNQRTPDKGLRQTPDPRAAPGKLFVGGLSNSTTVEDYKAHFEKYGVVKDAVIMQDRVTNRSRGFGFVVYEDPDAVDVVLKEQARAGIAIDGKTVEVKPALPKEVMNGDTEGGGATQEPASPERVEFAEGMQYIETYMGYMPMPSSDDGSSSGGLYVPPPPGSAMSRGVPVIPTAAGRIPRRPQHTMPYVPVPANGLYYGPPAPYAYYRPMPPHPALGPPGYAPPTHPMGTAMQGVPIGDPVALSATLGYGYGGAFPDQNSAVFYPPSMRADGAAPPPFGGQLPAAFIPGAAASSAAPAAATAAS